MADFAFLKHTITQFLVDVCLTLKEETFSSKIYPLLKEKLEKKLAEMDSNEFLLLMGLKSEFGVRRNGRCGDAE